jgi:hypothetical protein
MGTPYLNQAISVDLLNYSDFRQVQYHNKWRDIQHFAMKAHIDFHHLFNIASGPSSTFYLVSDPNTGEFQGSIVGQLKSLDLFRQYFYGCSGRNCSSNFEQWKEAVGKKLQSIPKFSTFLLEDR